MPSADMDDATGDKEVVYENTYITSPEGYGKVSRKKRPEEKASAANNLRVGGRVLTMQT